MTTTGTKAGGSTNRFVLGMKEEAAWGVTPVGNYSAVRITGESLGVDESTTESEELRSDRQTSDVVRTQFDATGSFDFEWSRDSFDDLIASGMESAWSTKVDESTTLNFVASTKTITDADTSGAFTNVAVGHIIRIGGSASNNGFFRVVTKASANSITVAETIVDETGSGDETVEGSSVSNGVDVTTFSLIGGFTDVDVYKLFTGMSVGEFSLDCSTGAIVTGSMTMSGKSVAFDDTAPTVDDAPDTRVFDSVNHFGGLLFDGAEQAGLTSITLAVTNNLEMQRRIGAIDAYGLRDGRFQATGSLTAYLADTTFLDSFKDETEVSLQFRLIDNTGYGYVFYLPRIRLSNADASAGGSDEDALVSFDYTALASSTLGYTLQISRFTDAV